MSISNKRPFLPNQNTVTKTSLLGPDPGSVTDYLTRLKPASIKQANLSQNAEVAVNVYPSNVVPPPAPYAGYVDQGYVLINYVENTL
jgi:hypothetical protein